MQLLVPWAFTEGLRQREGRIWVDQVVETSGQRRLAYWALWQKRKNKFLPECIPDSASMPKSPGTNWLPLRGSRFYQNRWNTMLWWVLCVCLSLGGWELSWFTSALSPWHSARRIRRAQYILNERGIQVEEYWFFICVRERWGIWRLSSAYHLEFSPVIAQSDRNANRFL